MATAIAITRPTADFEAQCQEIATAYIRSMEDMAGRAPGRQSMQAVGYMTPGYSNTLLKWNEIPYSPSGGGCGGAMRTMCIGLKYASADKLKDLVAVSIESGRITHNHPVGFLGAMVAALFTSYAVQGVATRDWATKLMVEAMPMAREYLRETEVEPHRVWSNYEKGWNYFVTAWTSFMNLRHLPTQAVGVTPIGDYPVFPSTYGFIERDEYYNSISFDGWGGSSGHDSVIIAYDALLGAGDSWKEMIERSAIHGGDSDSTAAIGCAWWGAIYGFKDVPDANYQGLEYRPVLYGLAKTLFEQKL
eukprot:gene16342-19439_t